MSGIEVEVDVAGVGWGVGDFGDLFPVSVDGNEFMIFAGGEELCTDAVDREAAGTGTGRQCQNDVSFFAASSMRVISPDAESVTKIAPLPSPTAELGRPGSGMVAVTWLVALSMTVTLQTRGLNTKTDLRRDRRRWRRELRRWGRRWPV